MNSSWRYLVRACVGISFISFRLRPAWGKGVHLEWCTQALWWVNTKPATWVALRVFITPFHSLIHVLNLLHKSLYLAFILFFLFLRQVWTRLLFFSLPFLLITILLKLRLLRRSCCVYQTYSLVTGHSIKHASLQTFYYLAILLVFLLKSEDISIHFVHLSLLKA